MVVWRCGLESGLGGGLGGGSGRPYVAIPGFGGGLGGGPVRRSDGPCDDDDDEAKATETRGAQQPKLMHRGHEAREEDGLELA